MESDRRPEDLSPRQLAVFRAIGEGKDATEIAQDMGIARRTVNSHCEFIKARLNVRTFRELIRLAILWVQSQSTVDKKETGHGEAELSPMQDG